MVEVVRWDSRWFNWEWRALGSLVIIWINWLPTLSSEDQSEVSTWKGWLHLVKFLKFFLAQVKTLFRRSLLIPGTRRAWNSSRGDTVRTYVCLLEVQYARIQASPQLGTLKASLELGTRHKITLPCSTRAEISPSLLLSLRFPRNERPHPNRSRHFPSTFFFFFFF